jgi:hypothetical protein
MDGDRVKGGSAPQPGQEPGNLGQGWRGAWAEQVGPGGGVGIL